MLTATQGSLYRRAPQTSPPQPQAQSVSEIDLNHYSWQPQAQIRDLDEIGKGKGIIFSPDLSKPANREFYQKLGFAYFEDASWQNVLDQIEVFNLNHDDEHRIVAILIESHGANGNGLKLQDGERAEAGRSYISIGALQERLADARVRICILAACNAGRLFRPQIFRTLDEHVNDPLFLPASYGIINASENFNPETSNTIIARRADSHIETIIEGNIDELSYRARSMLGFTAGADSRGDRSGRRHFFVSDMLIQLLINDRRLHLTATGFSEEKSHSDISDNYSEDLYAQFISYIDRIARGEDLVSTNSMRRTH